jgi:uncharacterized membrane protein YhiD involved in acid resistance
MGAGAGFWKGAVITTIVALISLRPLEWVKIKALPGRTARHVTVNLNDGGSSGDVLDAVERVGEVLALRRDGNRLEIEVEVERALRGRLLDTLAALPQVEEARWH